MPQSPMHRTYWNRCRGLGLLGAMASLAVLLRCASEPPIGPDGSATQLAFAVHPIEVLAGVVITPAVRVRAEDAAGHVMTDFTGPVTVGLFTTAADRHLLGSTTVVAVRGVASFTNLVIDGAGDGYLLIATAPGLTSATSTSFAAKQAHLVFTVQPSDFTAGTIIKPAVRVTAQDSAGHVVAGFTGPVTAFRDNDVNGPALQGTTTVTAIDGVASFANLSIDRPGYLSLVASAPGLANGRSAPFTSLPPQLVFTVQPTDITAGVVLTPAVQVTAETPSGRTASSFRGSVSLGLGTNPSSGHLSGTTTAAFVAGVATFADLTVDSAAAGYTLTASALGLATVTSTAFAATPCVSGCWTSKAAIPLQRYDLSVAVVQNILYSVGGAEQPYGEGINGSVEAYSPATDSWSSRAAMPTPRTELGTGAIDGVIYAVGGYNDFGLSAAVEAYDPASDSWTTRSKLPTSRFGLGVGVVNGVLYAVGGFDAARGGALGDVEAYSPATNSWGIKRAPMPTPRREFGIGVVNGILYAVGGVDAGGVSNLVEAYDPAADSWSTKAPMSTPRGRLAVGVVNGLLYAVGGLSWLGSSSIEVYDPATDTWTTKGPPPPIPGVLGAGVLNGVVFVVGSTTTLAYHP